MGKKSDAAKASLAVAFLAAGGTAVAGASAGTPSNPEAVVSSYFGGMGLRDNFQAYFKIETGFQSFYKYYKLEQSNAIYVVVKFSLENGVDPPPGFGDGDGGGDVIG